MFDPPDELLERLRSPHVTPNDVFQFIYGQHGALVEEFGHAPDPRNFFQGQADLDHYHVALAWWPKGEHVPPQLAPPTVWQLCFRYEEQDPRIGSTFLARLTARANAVVSWINAQGLDVSNPNETEEERRKRQNREAVRRHRVRKGDAGTPEDQARELEIKAAYDHWQALSKGRAAVLADLDQRVQQAHEAFLAVCEERKHARAHVDAQVQAAKQAWKDLKNKPA